MLALWHRQVLRHVCQFQCSYIVTDSRPPARRPACPVQFRYANWPDRQLGGACADRLRVNTPIYLYCIRRRSRTGSGFAGVCENGLRRGCEAARLLGFRV
jgi:hypothetical protein